MKYSASKEEKTDDDINQLEDIATKVALSVLDKDDFIYYEDLVDITYLVLYVANKYEKLDDSNLNNRMYRFLCAQPHYLSYSFKLNIYKFIKRITVGRIYKEELFLFKNLLKSINKISEVISLLISFAKKHVTGAVEINIDPTASSIQVKSAKMTPKGIELYTDDRFYLCKDFSEAVRAIQSKGMIDGYPEGYYGKDLMTPSDSMF